MIELSLSRPVPLCRDKGFLSLPPSPVLEMSTDACYADWGLWTVALASLGVVGNSNLKPVQAR